MAPNNVQPSVSVWEHASQMENSEATLNPWVLEPSSPNQTQAPPPSQQAENSPPTLAQRLQRVNSVISKLLYATYKDPVIRLIVILCLVYPTVYQVIKLHWAIAFVFASLLRVFSIEMQSKENKRAKLSGDIPQQVGALVFLSNAFGLCLGIFAERTSHDSVILCWLLHFVWSETFLLIFVDDIRALCFPASRGWETCLDED